MHLILTGISGFLGRQFADLAHAKGHTITAIVRVGHKQKYDGVKVIECDLVRNASLTSEMKSADAVIHCAADTNMSSRRINSAWSFNVRGTENLVRESKAAGVKRFIHISTANTLSGDESNAISSSRLPYIQSKIENERMLLQEFRDSNFPVVILNPSFILGPASQRWGSTELIKTMMSNRILFYTRGGKNVVDVRDVAAAVLNAVTMGKTGQRYLLVNTSMPYRNIIDVVDSSLNRNTFKLRLPDLLCNLVGYSGTALSLLRSRGSTINHVTMGLAMKNAIYTTPKAHRELGFTARPAEETIIDTVKSLSARISNNKPHR
ncbi:MAG: NAD-dependent epimerase/dehydratase family protein [Bacteroidota bacterium]